MSKRPFFSRKKNHLYIVAMVLLIQYVYTTLLYQINCSKIHSLRIVIKIHAINDACVIPGIICIKLQ